MEIGILQQLFKQATKEKDWRNVIKLGNQLLDVDEDELTHDDVRYWIAQGIAHEINDKTPLAEIESHLAQIEELFAAVKAKDTQIRSVLASTYVLLATRQPKNKDVGAKITQIAERGLAVGLTKYELKDFLSIKSADKVYFNAWQAEIENREAQEASQRIFQSANELRVPTQKVQQLLALEGVEEVFAVERFKQFLTKYYSEKYPDAVAALTGENAEYEAKLLFNKTSNYMYTLSRSRYYLSYQTAQGWTRTGEVEFPSKQSYENRAMGIHRDVNFMTDNTKGDHIIYEDVEVINTTDTVRPPSHLKVPSKYDIEQAAQELFNLKVHSMTNFKYQVMQQPAISYEKSMDVFVPVYRIILRCGKYTVNGYLNAVETTRGNVNMLIMEEIDGKYINLLDNSPAPKKECTTAPRSARSLLSSVFAWLALIAQAIPYIFGNGFTIFAGLAHLSFIVSLFIKNKVVRNILYAVSIALLLVGTFALGGGQATDVAQQTAQAIHLLSK